MPDHLTSPISNEITAFIIDRQARRCSPKTISFYEDELRLFQKYLLENEILVMSEILPDDIRQYLIDLSARRSQGGVHAAYRAIKAFFNWYEAEIDEPLYRNPIKRVKPPKITATPLPGVSLEHIQALLRTCARDHLGQRDRAMILALLDTGLRRNEFLALNYADLNLKTGAVIVKAGKGGEPRTIFAGHRVRREIVRYLRYRGDLLPRSPLWTTQSGERLTPSGLRQVLRRRAGLAGIPAPQIHDFRRAFALQALRNGANLITLMRLMGHTSTRTLARYLRLVDDDLRQAHEEISPVDNFNY